jgi:hypothetical protein
MCRSRKTARWSTATDFSSTRRINDRDRKHDALQRLHFAGICATPVMLERDGPLPHPAGDSDAVTHHTFPTESRMNEENRG